MFCLNPKHHMKRDIFNASNWCFRLDMNRKHTDTGFIPSLGIHHDGHLNAFNLVDDLIEPFRPIVDRAVVERLLERDSQESSVLLEDRQAMAAVLGRDVVADGGQLTLLNATEPTAEFLRKAMQHKQPDRLQFPSGW